MKYAFLISCIPFLAYSQSDLKPTPISMDYGIGTISSFESISFAFECGLVPCDPLNEVFAPVSTKYFMLLVNYHFNTKHKFGIGGSFSERGFTKIRGLLGSDETFVSQVKQKYKCLKARYLVKLYSGYKFHLSVGNSIELEFLDRKHLFLDTRRHTLSHLFEVNTAYDITCDLQVSIGLLYRTSIINASEGSTTGTFTRFGKGAMLGVSHRF